jgi:putative spermidine/putrescine transport system permease protein
MEKHEFASSMTMEASRRPWLARKRPAKSLFIILAVSPILSFLIVPTAVVIPMSLTPRNYIEFPPSGLSVHSFSDVARDAAWTSAVSTSLQVALIAVVVACATGAMAAIALHGAKFRGKSVVVGIILMPIVIPLVVLGLADFQFLARYHLVGTVLGIGLAHSVIATPYAYLTVEASLAGLDPALIRAARSLGAGSVSLFRHVYLPAMSPGLFAGAVLAFAVSFDEAVISFFLQGPGATTIAVKMFTDIQYELTPKIAAVSTMLVGMAVIGLLSYVAFLMRQRRKRSEPMAIAGDRHGEGSHVR